MKKLLFTLIFLAFQASYGQWESLNSGLTGLAGVYALNASDGYIYAGNSSGLFISSDNGKTWNKSLIRDWTMDIFSMDDYVIAGTSQGIYKSTDNGKNWKYKTNFYVGTRNKIILHNGNLYASSGCNIIKSTDKGETWKSVLTNTTYVEYGPLASFKGVLYLGYNEGILASSDGGSNWVSKKTGLPNKSKVRALANAGNRLLAGVYGGGIYETTDSGENWRRIGLDTQSVSRIIIKDSDIIVGTEYNGLHISHDNGVTWEKVAKEFRGKEVNTICFSGDDIIANLEENILYSNDMGRSWNKRNEGFYCGIVYDMASDGNVLYVIALDGLFISSDKGESWEKNKLDIDFENAYISVNGDKLAVWVNLTELYVSTDAGESWKTLGEIKVEGENLNHFTSILLDKENIYAATGDGLYLSTDYGVHWDRKLQSPIQKCVYEVVKSNDSIYAATIEGVYVSGDDGESWILKPTMSINFPIGTLLISDNAYLFQNYYQIKYSKDYGNSWNTISGGIIDNLGIDDIALYNDNIIVGGFWGTCFSSNFGQTWIPIIPDQTNKINTGLEVIDEYLFGGLFGGGLYRAKLSDLGIKGVEDPVVGSNLKLFPNPASEYLTIELSEAFATERIIISDLLGNIVLEAPRSGSNQQKIDISRLRPGAYALSCGGKRAMFAVVR